MQQFFFCISIIAIFISFCLLLYVILLQRHLKKYIKTQNELNEFLIQKEKKEKCQENRAEINAEIIKCGENSYHIRVCNHGKATAKNVTFALVDTKLPILDSNFPLEYLDPCTSVDIILALWLGYTGEGKCKVTWEDSLGQHEKEILLVLSR